MRKIDEQAAAAFHAFREFKSGNTQVKVDYTQQGRGAHLYLHNNLIAVKRVRHRNGEFQTYVRVSLAGWQTKTTMARLKALGADLYQKDHVAYLDGEAWEGDWKELQTWKS